MNESMNRQGASQDPGDKPTGKMGSSYGRFAAMIATSTVIMYGLMYLNTYQLDHVYFSQTRVCMAIYMGATMAVIMLGYMLNMYKNSRVNLGIVLGQPRGLRRLAVAAALTGHGRRRGVHEGHDPAPLHRHPDQQAGPDQGSPRA